jgi:hypothetical protein
MNTIPIPIPILVRHVDTIAVLRTITIIGAIPIGHAITVVSAIAVYLLPAVHSRAATASLLGKTRHRCEGKN